MPVSEQAILDALESRMMLSFPYPPTIATRANIDGVLALRSAKTALHDANFVGCARLSATNVTETIAAVKAFYAELDHAFMWATSDLSTPATLGEELQAAGFGFVTNLDGLVMRGLDHQIAVNPRVTVRLAQAADRPHVHRLYRDAYPFGDDELTSIALEMQDALNTLQYLAYIADEPDPVAVASMYTNQGVPIVSLQGAATLEAFRGQGIYTALVAKRLDDARAAGMEVAILQAIADTSAPICAKLGFEKMLNMAFYAYPPFPDDHV